MTNWTSERYAKVKAALARRKQEKYAKKDRELKEKVLKELNLPEGTLVHISRRGSR